MKTFDPNKGIDFEESLAPEVIINGDSPILEPPAVGTVVPPKTEAQKLARKNKLKAKNTLSMDDLYNNLKVYDAEIKGKSSSGSNSYNVAFVSYENTNSINETVNPAHDIPAAGLKEQPFASIYADDGNRSVNNERRVITVETPVSALVVQDGLGGYDWSYQAKERPTDFALMAHSLYSTNSSNSEDECDDTAKRKNVTTTGPKAVVNDTEGKKENVVKHMTGNKSFLTEYQELDGGFVAFGGSPKGGKITGKGKIRTGKLDFEDVYFVKELKFNLFSVSQMCDKKNNVLFTETECLVLSLHFKLLDKSQVLLKVPRKNNMYSFDLKNVVPSGDLTCLFVKDTIDESNLWHR
nr:ribonuclease H-like domain-containing protein [Tanacetum cinerariifolium]